MPHLTGTQAFFEVARSEGVRYLFANPGTTELQLYDELADSTGIELILGLHEATAVAAADGYAQATRRPALVNLHIAPGVANGLGNIFNAAWAGSPLVITAGNQHTGHIFGEPMLAADLVRMVEQFCKWSYEVKRPEDVGPALRRAFKIAASPPTGPVFVSIPWNYLDEGGDVDLPPPSPIAHGSVADRDAVRQAAEALLAAGDPMILAGDEGARAGALPDLVALAEALGARVVGEPLHGRLVFPMDHPLWRGTLLPINVMIKAELEKADTILAAGPLMFAPFFPWPEGALPADRTVVQIHSDPYQIAKTYPVTLGLRGDVAATVRAIRDEVERLATPEQREAIEARRARLEAEHRATLDEQDARLAEQLTQVPLPAIAACRAAVDAFDGPVSVVDESVTASIALRSVLRQRDPDSYFFFRGGGLGWALPAAAGVQLAQPDRKVVAFSGDGAACYVPQALWTLAHHDIPATIVVLNNGGYYILKAQLLGMGGKAAKSETYPGMDIAGPPVDFLALGKAFGVPAERVEKASEVTAAVRDAIAADGPRLVEVPIDATVRPLM